MESSSGSPVFNFCYPFKQQVGELGKGRALYQDALHRNAGLAGIGEASHHTTVSGVSQVGVAVHDHASIAPQLEDNFLFPAIFLDLPAHGGAAGETDQLDPFIRYQQSGVFVRERQHVQTAVRPARLLNRLCQQQSSQWSLRRGFEHERTPSGDRRCNLMSHQIQREIEWSDPGNRSQREAAHNAPASGSKFLPVERQVLAVNPSALLGGNIKGEDGALDFSPCSLDRLSRFLRHGAGKFLFALRDVLRNPAQHALALESREPPGGTESFDCGRNRGLGMFPPALKYGCDYSAVIRSAYLDRVAFFDPLAIDKETLGADRSRSHLGHGVILDLHGKWKGNYRPSGKRSIVVLVCR